MHMRYIHLYAYMHMRHIKYHYLMLFVVKIIIPFFPQYKNWPVYIPSGAMNNSLRVLNL